MLNVSKWIKLPLLLDGEEMAKLFASIDPCALYEVHRVVGESQWVHSLSDFLETYRDYVFSLKEGKEPPLALVRQFAYAMSVTSDAFTAQEVGEKRILLKATLPIVQMQPHALRYSPLDGTFRSGVHGEGTISWGIQLGYPQIYEDPRTHLIQSTRELTNGPLFQQIQKWVRAHTRPTPFEVDGKKQIVPARLGKSCFAWIARHPHLHTVHVVTSS